MTKPPYFGRALLSLLLSLPLLFQVFAVSTFVSYFSIAEAFGLASELGVFLTAIPFGALFLFLCFRSGRRVIRKLSSIDADTGIPAGDFEDCDRFWVRYLPVIFVFAYTLFITLLSLLLPVPTESAIFGPAVNVIIVAHLSSSLVLGMGAMMGTPSPWMFLIPPLAIYAAYGFGLAWGFREQGAPRIRSRSMLLGMASVAVFLGLIIWRADYMMRGIVRGDTAAWYAEKRFNALNSPFVADNQLVVVPAPTLTIAENHPRLDGATAAYPIYAAAIQAIYKNVNAQRARELIISSTTPEAYDRLIAGETDLIFVAQPSTEQRAQAEAAGHPLQLTPIAKEAFVFFVHAVNPVDGLTSDQIRAIYTKKITNWKEVGGRDEPILPFQRPAGSGSQTALELKVLKGEKPAKPLREEIAPGMGGVIQRVATYQNSTRSIGYSFRVYATTLNTKNEIKLLKIDGVAPIRETIRSSEYPYTVNLYAATAGTTNPHVPKLLAWFLSPQGQHLINETGYVSLLRYDQFQEVND